MIRMSEKEFETFAKDRFNANLWGEPTGSSIIDEIEQRAGSSRVKNRESSMRGQAFEELIKLQCEKYKEQGTAVIDKTPEPFRVYKKKPGGMFEGRFTGAKAQPDFQGTLNGGQSILIEAKSTSKDRILFGAVTEHQQELLEMHSKARAVCLILCEIGDRHFSVPWLSWENMKALYGHQHVNTEDIRDYEIISGENGIFPFLNTVNQVINKAG